MTGFLPGSFLSAPGNSPEFRTVLRALPDPALKSPLWEWKPGQIKAVISERRRRFGVDEEEFVYG
ncbi:hypothetical protein H9Y04_18325 [Streptomyces sp. TRM66268-LWL]|uniref:Uncharacterized protein n=1 Tax=Streptomyces polyasparticus TaxID=2767826 RepID=A0ABR7SGA5_9ACTN|nr:hypothetical protein [Streptomyces polyasparticus]MBC9714517.1 hypothetical protein [Streptomyces polyasparticus]